MADFDREFRTVKDYVWLNPKATPNDIIRHMRSIDYGLLDLVFLIIMFIIVFACQFGYTQIGQAMNEDKFIVVEKNWDNPNFGVLYRGTSLKDMSDWLKKNKYEFELFYDGSGSERYIDYLLKGRSTTMSAVKVYVDYGDTNIVDVTKKISTSEFVKYSGNRPLLRLSYYSQN